jgi:hypothetical protein
MKEIRLTNGMIAQVSDEDFDELNKFTWSAAKQCRTYYPMRDIYSNGTHTRIKMHTIIMNGKLTDHIDNNGLNNQRSNLRECTPSQNSMNTRSHLGSSSKYKGVSWASRFKKWRAEIYHNKKNVYLGMFKDEIDAARAYDEKCKEFFGEWGKLNFI